MVCDRVRVDVTCDLSVVLGSKTEDIVDGVYRSSERGRYVGE